jgi:hypothetical protein
MLEYLSYFEARRQNAFKKNNLKMFSDPANEKGYNDVPISNDMITEIYLEFIKKTRQQESVEYCKTRTGKP